ncbi:hypothetical protein [Eggerthella sinensis]|uniref:Uncharacterized protein n=1 Tax=Eggerthella sinensis TaxID=242230 RepID=A0A3N0ITE5_9ACTN|nr:hypothetical protein [Eggerthella sinensis]RDB63652.1 hypothetical protein C1876_16775 [Eggerthella sinensis]RNM40279.1 hypothetical protein DMP09_15100 [Eggerthella sinensis]
MTRRGSAQRPWTTDELERLRGMAGRLPVREVCRELKRSKGAVKMAASRLGLSLRCCRTRLVWCDECASWRSALDRDGRCRVCRMRSQLAGREAACAGALAAMTPEQRAVYAESESRRATRSFPPRPRKRESCPVSRYEREKARAAYLLELEEWEYRRALLPYNAAKTRLRRMREATGTNPRKSK